MHPVESAESLLKELIGSRRGSRGRLPIEELPDAIRDFQAVGFDVPQTADADGFLFQYGPASWLESPTFVCGLTRQFEIIDDTGEHECYSQVSVEYKYPLDDVLRAVPSRESWWFHGTQAPFGGWLDGNLSDPIWEELRGREIGEVAVSQEIV